jgi:hypothetical protein
LHHFITVSTRRASPSEARRRRRIGLGPLSGLVILSACSTTPATFEPPPPIRNIYSYFGNVQPVAKPQASASRPVFTGVAFSQAFDRASAIVEQSPDSFASKTLASASGGALAYFDDSSYQRIYAPRKEADLAPTVLAAASPTPDARPVEAVQVEPLQLLALSFSTTEPAAPVTSRVYAFAERVLERAKAPPPLLKAAAAAPPAPRPASPSPVPKAKLDFGDAERPDLYSDLIAFGNSSSRLDPAAITRIQALVSAAKYADAVQLRGRFGNRNIDDSMARIAVARAIAVRAALVAHGVPLSKIRIQMPRQSDLLVPSEPTHESNRSVSVFMVVPEQRAAALGLHRGKPIASVTTSTPAS